MSMTKEETIKQLESLYDHCENMRSGDNDFAVWERDCEAIKIALSALRPVSREQVERVWRGEWIAYLDGEHIMPERYYSCSKCGGRGHLSKKNFCDFCGAPMTDEAVETIMKRMEEMRND